MKVTMTIEIDKNQENAIESFLRQFQNDRSVESDFCAGRFVEECCWAGGLEDMHSRVERFAKREIGSISWNCKIKEVA